MRNPIILGVLACVFLFCLGNSFAQQVLPLDDEPMDPYAPPQKGPFDDIPLIGQYILIIVVIGIALAIYNAWEKNKYRS